VLRAVSPRRHRDCAADGPAVSVLLDRAVSVPLGRAMSVPRDRVVSAVHTAAAIREP